MKSSSQLFFLGLGLFLLACTATRVAAAGQIKEVKNIEARTFAYGGGKAELKDTAPIDAKKNGQAFKFETALHLTDESEIVVSLDLVLGGDLSSAKDFKPEQRLLTLTHSARKTKVARIVGDVKSHETEAGTFSIKFTVTSENLELQTGTMSGDYDAEVVVADTRFESSFKQKFGSIFVTHAQKSDGSIPSDPPLDAREFEYAPKPEFDHVMRQPEKRPPAFLSLVFTGATLCPLGLLLLVLLSSGANLKGMDSVFSALIFHSSIAVVLGIIFLYWLKMPLLKTLPILSTASAFAALSGYRHLKGIAKRKAS